MIAVELANPFPGLRPFEPEEDYLFFGREQRVDELLSTLRRTHFLSVVGDSGSGKSSLVRAGLVPALYGGAMVGSGSQWRVAMFRPGEDPLGRMARALNTCGLIDDAGMNGSGNAMLEATLRRSSLGLAEAFRLAGVRARVNLLVLVDQFEEVFRYRAAGKANYQDDAVAFVKLLLAAAEADPRIYVALTLRSDFIGSCADYPGLPSALTAGQYLIPRMTRSETRHAIVGPIAAAGEEIAPRLVVRLLNDAGEDPDQLPIMQHALMRTWEYWKRDHRPSEPIDIRHYEAIGGMARALSLHADEAFAELSSDRQRYVAEKTFKALTETDAQGRGVRRPATLKNICAIGDFAEDEVKNVLERFRDPARAFLAPPANIPLESSSMLDLAHESLMRVWTRLQGWVAEEQQAREIYVRLSESAVRHARGEQSLWRNPELGLALQWLSGNAPNAAWASRYSDRPDAFPLAITFLTLSRRAEKKRQIVRWTSLGALVFLALAALGIYALLERSENARLRAANQQLNQTIARLQAELKSLRALPPQAAAAPTPAQPPELPSSAKSPSNARPKASLNRPAVEPAPVEQLSEFATDMLTAHNAVRSKHGVASLLWSSALAAKAQTWADTLAQTGETKMEGIHGQNIGYVYPPGRQKGSFVVYSWAAEEANFDYEKAICLNPALKCYHYTQVVWRDSKYVGCATAHDAQRDIWVCDYDPAGNIEGVRPF